MQRIEYYGQFTGLDPNVMGKLLGLAWSNGMTWGLENATHPADMDADQLSENMGKLISAQMRWLMEDLGDNPTELS